MFNLKWKYVHYLLPLLFLAVGWQLLYPMTRDNLKMIFDLFFHSGGDGTEQVLQEEQLRLRKRHKNLDEAISVIVANFPQRENLSRIYEELNRRAVRRDVTIEKLMPQPLVEDSLFDRLELTLCCRADFRDIVGYIHEIEDSCSFIRVEKLSLQTSPQEKNRLTGEILFSAKVRQDRDKRPQD
jgi:Tfp pilus assembly protein PilO